MSRMFFPCRGADSSVGRVGEKKTKPEIFLIGIQEGEFFREFLLNPKPFVAEQAGEEVVPLGIKDILIGQLFEDLKIKVGDQQIGIDMEKISGISHPKVHPVFQSIQAPILLRGIDGQVVVIQAESDPGPHFQGGNGKDTGAGSQVKDRLGNMPPE